MDRMGEQAMVRQARKSARNDLVHMALCVTVAFFLCLSRVRGQEAFTRPALTVQDIDKSLRTDWYGLYLKNKKVGYAKTEFARFGTGADAGIRDALFVTAKLVSAGVKAELKIEQIMEFDERPPFRLRYASSGTDDGESREKTKLVRTGKGYTARHASGGEERVERITGLDFTLGDVFAPDLFLRKIPKAGDKLAFRDFSLEKVKIDPNHLKVLSVKTALANGVPITFFEVEIHSALDDLTVRSVFDSSGRMLSGQVSMLEMRLEPEDQAKNIAYSQDLFVLGMAKVDRPLGEPTRLTALVLESPGKDAPNFPPGARQAAVTEAGTVTLKLGKKYGRPVKATAKEIEDNLIDTSAYPTRNPKVIALAKKAIGNATTPEEKVKRLVGFVHDYIHPELIGGKLTVFELLRTKKGCCREYALFFNTLARAAGIPAREVSGLMYVGDDEKAFGGHAWNEVVLDGCWVPVDAAWGEVEVNATHINFGSDSRGINNVLDSLGKLRFRVLDVERN